MHTTIKKQVAKFYFIVVLGVIISLAATVLSNIFPKAHAATGLQIRGVDVMKFTKDVMRNQPSDNEINNIISSITSTIKPTHISISIPLDNSNDYAADQRPAPRDAYAFAKAWTDSIHNKNTKVIFRGTFNGIEGIYNFPRQVGSNRFPAGTAASAPTDGNRTWLGKIYSYILSNPDQFRDGDIWAPLPERTENIFNDNTSFLPHDGAGIQANYEDFFVDLKKVSDAAFAKIGKKVITGMTANNYTEVATTWLYPGLFNATGIIAIDHYGSNHTPEEMESDIRKIHSMHNKPVFLQEWGDYWNEGMNETDRMRYLDRMYAVWQKLTNEGILIGFNYWGGWPGDHEGILSDTGNETYSINNRGTRLASFFSSNTGGSFIQVPAAPTPPTQTPTITPAVTPPAPQPNPAPKDTTPPAITDIATKNVTTNSATITWNTSEDSDDWVEYGKGTGYGQQTTPNRTGVTTIPNLTAGTLYHYRVVAKDTSGNISTSRDVIFTTTQNKTAKPVPSVVLPQNSREGDTVKFSTSPTIYLVTSQGLFPFHSWQSYIDYRTATKKPLRKISGTPTRFTIHSTVASEILRNRQLAGSTGSVLGATDFPTGTLIQENQTIYMIVGEYKVPFTSWEAFSGLGFKISHVIISNPSSYPTHPSLQITSASSAHPVGSWVLHNGTVFFMSSVGPIGVPNLDILASNGGLAELIVAANAADIQKISTTSLAPLGPSDSRIE